MEEGLRQMDRSKLEITEITVEYAKHPLGGDNDLGEMGFHLAGRQF